MRRSVRLGVLVPLAGCALALGGCGTMREFFGIVDPGDPSLTLRAAPARWLLVKNPRFGDVVSEPEYVWVDEDNAPTTLRTFVFGLDSVLAPPEVVAAYGPPPGGGRVSPRHGGVASAAGESGAPGPAAGATRSTRPRRQGVVVQVDGSRIVVDLTGADGLKPGALLGVRRGKRQVVHPVSGEVLGELDEEVATLRVTETSDKFSIAAVQVLAPGASVRASDRVYVRERP